MFHVVNTLHKNLRKKHIYKHITLIWSQSIDVNIFDSICYRKFERVLNWWKTPTKSIEVNLVIEFNLFLFLKIKSTLLGIMSVEKAANGNSDDVLSEIEKFGPYQKFTCVLLSIMMIVVGQSGINYIITTNTLEYR